MLLGVVAQFCIPRYLGGRWEDLEFKTSLGKVSETLSQKQNKNKRTGGIAQVVEHLPSKFNVLSWVQSQVLKKEKKRKEKRIYWGVVEHTYTL
jgi:D-mannonate dehydratase